MNYGEGHKHAYGFSTEGRAGTGRRRVGCTQFPRGAALGAYAYSQDGRRSDSTAVDGARVQIDGEAFNANNSCLLYGLTVFDADTPVQVETGLLKCDSGKTLDGGSCTSGHAFAERAYLDGLGVEQYDCNQGNTFNNGQFYQGNIERDASSHAQMNGTIHGASISKRGFTEGDNIRTYAWGEVTSGSSCPSGTSLGNFHLWQGKFNGSWYTLNDPNVFPSGLQQCLTVGSYSDSTGNFDVH